VARVRDYIAERLRRLQLARERGFASPREQEQAPRQVRNAADLARLSGPARDRREDALRVVASMRREGMDLQSAAAQYSMSPHAVRYWAPGAFDPSGRLKPADREYRRMKIISGGRVVEVDVRGSHVASRIGEYWNAVRTYVDTGDDADLAGFSGFRAGGVEVETDLDVIDELALRDAFDFDSIYAMDQP
jgi:hypothetical protein